MDTSEKNDIKKTSWVLCIGVFLLVLIIYGVVNHLPLHRYTINFIFYEEKIHFLPWTFVIYISLLLQSLFILRILPQPFLKKALLSFFLILLISVAFFILLPIQYPRYMFPTTNFVGVLLRKIDNTGNCFPSLHVSIAILLAGCYSLTERSVLRRSLVWLWTIAIIFSVLTTKQHYLIDVLGGILLVLPFIFYLKISAKNDLRRNNKWVW
jgi:membrane-associated phospholipid phosphatase